MSINQHFDYDVSPQHYNLNNSSYSCINVFSYRERGAFLSVQKVPVLRHFVWHCAVFVCAYPGKQTISTDLRSVWIKCRQSYVFTFPFFPPTDSLRLFLASYGSFHHWIISPFKMSSSESPNLWKPNTLYSRNLRLNPVTVNWTNCTNPSPSKRNK